MTPAWHIPSGVYVMTFRQQQSLDGVHHWILDAVPDAESRGAFWIAVPVRPAKGSVAPLLSAREWKRLSPDARNGVRYRLVVHRAQRYMHLTLDRSSTVYKDDAFIELLHEEAMPNTTAGLWGQVENFYYLGQKLPVRSGTLEEAR